MLLIDGKAGFAQFVGQGVFIDLLEGPGPNPLGDRKGAADHKPRQPIGRAPII